MSAVSDVTASANEDATRLTKAELAELAQIAPQRLALVMTGNDFVSDVRLLPDNGGYATGNRTTFREHSFTTVLDDGFVVTTDAVVGRRGPMSMLASFGIYRLDPGFMMTANRSLANIYAQHVERVEHFTKSRNARVRSDHDLELYFAFREKRSAQIRRRAFIQFMPLILIAPLAFPPIDLMANAPFGRFNEGVFFVLGVVVCGVLGTAIDMSIRGSGPMLPASKSI